MWRVTLFFELENFTWTESHYLPAGGSVSSVTGVMIALANLRIYLLAPNAKIAAIRIENLTPPRTVYYLAAGTFASQGGFSNSFITTDPDKDAAPAWAAVKVRVQGAAGYSTEIYVSGIPEGIIGTGVGSSQGLEANPAWNNALQAYLLYLIQGNFSFRNRFYNNPLPQVQLVSQPAQAAGNIAIQTATALTFGVWPSFGPAIPSVVLKGFRRVNERQPGLSGIYKVAGLSPGIQPGAATPFVYYLQNTANVSPSNINILGQASGLTWVYDTYAILNPRGATHRKRGASALAPRGRSRNRV